MVNFVPLSTTRAKIWHSTTERRSHPMNLNDILTGILYGSGFVYLIGVGIGLHAFWKYFRLGDPRKATDALLQEHHFRLRNAINFRWLSMVFVAVAAVLNMFLRTIPIHSDTVLAHGHRTHHHRVRGDSRSEACREAYLGGLGPPSRRRTRHAAKGMTQHQQPLPLNGPL